MKTKHIVLRSRCSATPDMFSATHDIFAGPLSMIRGTESTIPDLIVEVDEIERSTISALTRNRNTDVVAIAPAIPMKLITPMKRSVVGTVAQKIAWGVKAIGADTSTFSGNGIVVAVLDTGIDSSHPAFSGVQIVENDFTGEGNGDQDGHGTHCAGTIFGRDTRGTRIGVAPGIKKALIGKVLDKDGGGSSEQICKAILWAIEGGANIISMSLGMDFPGYVKMLEEKNSFPIELATSRALEGYRANTKLFETLALLARNHASFSQATVVIAAAGNESQREVNPDWEIAVSPPAVAEGIISVAALGEGVQGLTVAPFSNTGANVSGPGVEIISAAIGGGLGLLSGTSMATPHVAGVAALWGEKLKTKGRLDTFELTSRVVGSATSEGFQPKFDPFDVGAGLVQAPQE